MSVTLSQTARTSFEDVYLTAFALCLLGYAVMGKGFAYVGAAPLYVGELLLAGGVLVLLRTGTLLVPLATPVGALLAVLMAWTIVRTVPFVGAYGIDALRDSVIIMYAGFAFVVVGLVVSKPSRLQDAVRLFQRFARLYVLTIPVIYVAQGILRDQLPAWPGAPVPIVSLRSGEIAVHLAGAGACALLGLTRVSWGWFLMLVAGIAVVFSQSRGGALAILLPLGLAAVVAGRTMQSVALAMVAATLLSAAYVLDLGVEIPGQNRHVEVRQVVDNLVSIVMPTGEAALDGTKAFRMEWWHAIIGYTVDGAHFWGGKGFGVNLAIDDGFLVGSENGGPPLRSPHNAHMTILARAGVPGIALWGSFLAAWFASLLRHGWIARRRGDDWWAKVLLFLPCYALAFLINATFDVALEGPMLGIWFWTVLGLGMAATMVYRYEIRSCHLQETKFMNGGGTLVALAVALCCGLLAAPAQAASDSVQRSISPDGRIAQEAGYCVELRGLSDAGDHCGGRRDRERALHGTDLVVKNDLVRARRTSFTDVGDNLFDASLTARVSDMLPAGSGCNAGGGR